MARDWVIIAVPVHLPFDHRYTHERDLVLHQKNGEAEAAQLKLSSDIEILPSRLLMTQASVA